MARSFSRLQRLEERKNMARASWFIIGTLVLIVLTITIGFNLLTKLFIFMGTVTSTNKPSEKTDFIPPGPPNFLSTYDATNSATIALKGMAEPASTIYLTQNTNSLGSVITSEDGTFEFNNIKLVENANSFSAVAMDAAGNRSQASDPLVISYSSKNPKLDISQPNDKQEFTGKDPKIQVKGITDPNVRLIVNDRVVIVGSDGSYVYNMVLNSGDNPITLKAVNEAGNSSQKQITVTYKP